MLLFAEHIAWFNTVTILAPVVVIDELLCEELHEWLVVDRAIAVAETNVFVKAL